MATELTIAQKKEYAGVLYLKDNLTQQEIAEKVGVSRQTLSKWIKAEKWEERKVGVTLTREEQISNLHRQVAEINKVNGAGTWQTLCHHRRSRHARQTGGRHQENGNRRRYRRYYQRGNAFYQLAAPG